jgi:hypothetical protein
MAALEVGLLWIAHVLGFAASWNIFSYRWIAYSLFGLVAGSMVFAFVVRLALAGQPRPLDSVVGAAKSEWPRFVSAVIGLQVIAISSGAFTSLKAVIPAVSPFWLDPPIARIEGSFGIMPWQLTHALFGWATPQIDLIYWSWFTIQPVALYLILLSKASAWKSQALVTFALTTLVLGVCEAYLLSSAGPIFYDRVFGGSTFAPLLAQVSDRAPNMMVAQQLLWDSYTSHSARLGNGISAMPSFHVALCAWLMLVTKGTRFSIPAKLYFVVIWIGSVHLGWHYFTDGLVASTGVLVLWKLAPVFTARRFEMVPAPIFARTTSARRHGTKRIRQSRHARGIVLGPPYKS